jgi:Mg-chelatase subunit ChlD
VLAGQAGISMMDPDQSTEGLLTLATAQAALGQKSGPPSRALVTSLVTLSTRVLDRGPEGVASPGAAATAFPTSEQTVIRANSGPGPNRLQAVYPLGEGMSLDFPVVQFVPATESASRRGAVSAFVTSLYQAATQRRLRAAGLRDAKGSAFPSTVGFDGIAPTATIRSLPQVSDQQITDSRRVWSAAQRRNRTLIVVDVSGSMLERGGEKIRFAAAAAKDAVGYLPDDAELGLWAFSTNLDGAAPWRQLVSVGPLGSPADEQARRQMLRSQTDQLPGLAQSRGNTGLYRTTWDAFQTVRRGYDPRRYNSVVVVTDGTNTGAGLTRSDLLARLKAAQASSRPLPVSTVAIGPDADQGTLKAISAATGGSEYSVDTASDIREVFLDAVIKEGS